jgi:hypothetical protein
MLKCPIPEVKCVAVSRNRRHWNSSWGRAADDTDGGHFEVLSTSLSPATHFRAPGSLEAAKGCVWFAAEG